MRVAHAVDVYATSSSNEELRFLIPSLADRSRSIFELPGLPKVHKYGKDLGRSFNVSLQVEWMSASRIQGL